MRILVGVLVTIAWGLSFSMISIAEETFDPLFLLAMRFVLCFLPAAFFVPRPRVPVRLLTGYGLAFGIGQFGLLFFGIEAGLSAGLASVVLQLQVFFTIVLGAALLRERMAPGQVAGLVVAAVGVTMIGASTQGTASFAGLLLVVCAAMSWGVANILVKKMGQADPIGLIVWSSPVPMVLLLLCAFLLEGPSSITNSLRTAEWSAIGAVLFLAYVTTFVGYSVWNALLQRYEAGRIAPLTLLVPVFGLAASAVILAEAITPVKVVASALLILGLGINQFSGNKARTDAARSHGTKEKVK